MRILVLTDEIYPDEIGGVSKSQYSLCLAWVRAGHHITIFVRASNSGTAFSSNISGIQIQRFRGPRAGSLLYRLFPLSILFSVRQYLLRSGGLFDVIYVNNPWYLAAVAMSGIYRHVPVVNMVHMPLEEEIKVNAAHGKYGGATKLAMLAAKIMKGVENWALGYADITVTASSFVRTKLEGDYSKARNLAEPVDLGIDTEFYRPIDKQKARKQAGLPMEKKILLTVRRLEGRMGIANLVSAMSIIKNDFPDVLLLIGGRGYLKDFIYESIQKNGLTDRVHLIGFIDETDLPMYMGASDLFVLPTEWIEGFGLVTIEALACGLPVIGTPIGHTPELLKQINPRLVTQDESPEAIAQAVIGWLARSEDLQQLRTTCRQYAESRYNNERVGQKMIKIFEEAAAIKSHVTPGLS